MPGPIAAARAAISNAIQRLHEADEALAAYDEEARPEKRNGRPGRRADEEASWPEAIADEVVRHLRESQGRPVRLVMSDDDQFQQVDAAD